MKILQAMNIFLKTASNNTENILSRYEKGLCNGLAFRTFLAALIGEQDKNHARISKLLKLNETELTEMGNRYYEYTQKRLSVIQGIKKEEDYIKINKMIDNFYKLPFIDPKKDCSYVIELQKKRDDLIENKLKSIYIQKEWILVQESVDIYHYVHSVVGSINPKDIELITISEESKDQNRLLTQNDFIELAYLFPPNKKGKNIPITIDEINLMVKEVYRIGFTFTNKEAIKIIEDTILEGDLVNFSTAEHTMYLSKNNEIFQLYNPEMIPFKNASELVSYLEEQIPKEKQTGLISLQVIIYEKISSHVQLRSKTRPDSELLITEIIQTRKKTGSKISINSREPDGSTAALAAVEVGDIKTTAQLIKEDANFLSMTNPPNQTTPLFMAAYLGRLDILKLLLKSKKEYISEPFNISNESIAIWAVIHRRIDIIKLLLAEKINLSIPDKMGYTAATMAAMNGNAEVINLLGENNKIHLTTENKFGDTPTIIASRLGHTKVLQTLEKKFVINIRASNSRGMDPIFEAAKHGRFETLIFLTNSKNIQEAILTLPLTKTFNDDENFPFLKANTLGSRLALFAAEQGHVDVIKELKKANIELQQQDSMGETAALKAAKKGHVEIIKVLHELKVDLTKPNKHDITCAMEAAKNGHINILNALVECNALTNAEMQQLIQKISPPKVSKDEEKKNIKELLGIFSEVEKAANDAKEKKFGLAIKLINAKDSSDNLAIINKKLLELTGETLATQAIKAGNLKVIEVLITAKANLKQPNLDGDTPAIVAVNQDQTEILKSLMVHDMSLMETRNEKLGLPSAAERINDPEYEDAEIQRIYKQYTTLEY